MPPMHAGEIGERHHGALRVGGSIAVMAEDPHQTFSLESFVSVSWEGTLTSASPSITTVSPTAQTQSKVTRLFTLLISRTVQVAKTVSPIRTVALNLKFALMKTHPAPGSLVPNTVAINVTESMPWAIRPWNRVVLA